LRRDPAAIRSAVDLAAGQGIAARDPALADTRWESWLRVSKADGPQSNKR